MMKKAQIQMGESIAVILIVIILLVIGIVFWSKANSKSIQETSIQAGELSVIEIANIVAEMPELKCYEASVSKVKCVDLYKARAFNDTVMSDGSSAYLYYNNYFKNSKITLRTIYPVVTTPEIVLYDSSFTNAARQLQIEIPVNIRDDVSKKTSYGLLTVEGYLR